MSLLPYILDEIFPTKRSNEIGSDLVKLTPRELKLLNALNSISQLRRAANRTATKNHIRKDGFQVRLNVQNYKPEEIAIKIVDDSIIVEAKCERKSDTEYVSSEIHRRFELPSGFRPEDVVSTMSSDGVLTIKCPRAPVDKETVRQIKIEQTGPVRQQCLGDEDKENAPIDQENVNRCGIF